MGLLTLKPAWHGGAIEKEAFADLWKNTLSPMPSVFGRLAYLSSLRDQNTGRYQHHGLAMIFGEDKANSAIRKSHAICFAEWIGFNLEEQKADLDLYLASLQEDRRVVLETWGRLTPYRNFAPNSARGLERKLYLSDIESLLSVLRNEHGVAEVDPGA